MSEEWKSSEDAYFSPWLGRIADALGIPASRFHSADGEFPASDQFKLDDAAVLALVRSYLQAADPDARRHFVESVTALVDELSP